MHIAPPRVPADAVALPGHLVNETGRRFTNRRPVLLGVVAFPAGPVAMAQHSSIVGRSAAKTAVVRSSIAIL